MLLQYVQNEPHYPTQTDEFPNTQKHLPQLEQDI